MEGIRAIAIAYYDRATRGEKDLVQQYFNEFDINGDGKISFKQYKNGGVAKHLTDENIFRKLDANGDGSLNFDEIVCLYYMEKKLGLHKCAACRDLLVGAYFSCLRCVEDGLDSECRLCCACYHLGEFSHDHSLSNFLDQHTMAQVMKNHTPDARRDRRKTELEELRQIAKSYYHAGSEEVQNLAHKFFDSMDMDRDGKVDGPEFLEFMKEEGYTRMQNPEFFKELDADGNGTLDFYEVMTAYYIIKSGRPFCDKCGNFVLGTFFSCVECYRKPKDSFNLCRDCYRSRKCDHKHDGRAKFLDNFALLEAMKSDSGPTTQSTKSDQQNHQAKSPVSSTSQAKSPLIPSNTQAKSPVSANSQAQAKSPVSSNSQAKSPLIPSNTQAKSPVSANSQAAATKTKSPLIPSNTQSKSPVSSHATTVPAANYTTNVIYNTYVVNPPPPVTNYYNAVIRPPHRNQWRFALKALEAAMTIGSIATTASMCTIM